jgi:hypothetical protein
VSAVFPDFNKIFDCSVSSLTWGLVFPVFWCDTGGFAKYRVVLATLSKTMEMHYRAAVGQK